MIEAWSRIIALKMLRTDEKWLVSACIYFEGRLYIGLIYCILFGRLSRAISRIFRLAILCSKKESIVKSAILDGKQEFCCYLCRV